MSGAADWAVLQTLFARRLGERIVVMHASLARIEAGEADVYAFLARQFHSLAGIGGTFGHHDLTDIAFDGEQACNAGAPVTRVAHFVAMIAQFGNALETGRAEHLAVPPSFIPISTDASLA
jgi:chemotaxis protein histidine kinase CheA